jgi:hypothetical protein
MEEWQEDKIIIFTDKDRNNTEKEPSFAWDEADVVL